MYVLFLCLPFLDYFEIVWPCSVIVLWQCSHWLLVYVSSSGPIGMVRGNWCGKVTRWRRLEDTCTMRGVSFRCRELAELEDKRRLSWR